MHPDHPLLQAPSLTLAPDGWGRDYLMTVSDRAGAALAYCDADGTVRDASGQALLSAPVRRHGRRDQPLRLSVEVADAWGRALGSGQVARYGVGPRAKKATVRIVDPPGAELGMLEPRDKGGDQLVLVANGADAGTVAVTHVKAGFMRKRRVYAAELTGTIWPPFRPLMLAVVIRYDALLDAVIAASARSLHER